MDTTQEALRAPSIPVLYGVTSTDMNEQPAIKELRELGYGHATIVRPGQKYGIGINAAALVTDWDALTARAERAEAEAAEYYERILALQGAMLAMVEQRSSSH